jgi:glycosyltransferase involved in cell wall biosynthesis
MSQAPDAAATIRVVPELRQAHVDRLAEMTPAQTIYFDVMYDLVEQPALVLARRLTLLSATRLLLRSRATVLEMPEPLWLRFLPRAVVLSLAWKLGGLRRGDRSPKRSHVVYALENNRLERLLGGDRRVSRPAVLLASLVLGLYVRLFVDRIAYGTAGARDLYHSLPLVKGVPHALVEALPVAAAEPASGGVPPRVAFVGTLDERKGLPFALEAWPAVERAVEGATIAIVGPGLLEPAARAWAAESPSSRKVLGQAERSEVRALLRESRVLVAPSQLEGRWCEQVGLPIVEALAEGCTIVTTQHTGLAPWLDGHGHGVVDDGPGLVGRLSEEMVRLTTRPLERAGVRSSLPAIDGRIQADRWLHNLATSDTPETEAPETEAPETDAPDSDAPEAEAAKDGSDGSSMAGVVR